MQGSKFGLTVLIGFGSVIVILIGVFLGLEMLKLDYDDFDQITSYQRILDQEEDQYIVYWYGSSCSHCALIKDQVLEFADDNNENIKVYMINSSNATGVANLEHPDDPDIAMTGTPTMIIIKDGAVADMVIGSEDIPALMELINSGNYDVID